MATIKSNYFLLEGKSYFTEKANKSASTANIKRSAVGSEITEEEKLIAGDFYNSTSNTIDMAKIYNLDFGPDYIDQRGASDEFMSKTQTKAYKDAFKKATGDTGPNLSFNQAVEAGKNWQSTPLNTDANGIKTLDTSYSGAPLYYPLATSDKVKYDYLQVSSYENAPASFGAEAGKGQKSRKEKTDINYATQYDSEERIAMAEGKVIGRVFLPMQPGLSEQSQVSWNQDTMNALEAVGTNIIGAGVEGATRGANQALEQSIRAGVGGAGDLLKDVNKDDIASWAASKAVGKNTFTRTSGKAVNPNLELLFNAPLLRTFSYSYRFTPRDGKEALMVKKIIRFFKRSMAPIRQAGRVFLQTPNVFKLKYIYKNGEQHPFLNRIKMCALQSFDVQYTPDGSYMTYDDGSMTAYQISLSFGELNPIYQEDFDKDSINDSMGY